MTKIDDRYEPLPLFESRKRGSWKTLLYRVFAASIMLSVVSIWVYRWIHFPNSSTDGESQWQRLGWVGMFAAELWFGLYWVLTQSFRWNPIYRQTFKDRLSHRYENELPGVDIFVCTADPTIEPPIMVINTVLSVMAYDYPPEKLSVYLSDDGGSDLTFYALLETSIFSKHWIPYCKKYKVEPRSPAAYFTSESAVSFDVNHLQDFASIKKLYEDLKNRIESATKLGRISEEVRFKHKGFSQWDSFSSPRDHDTILQILIDGRNREVKDIEGHRLPSLVYLAREKRPQHPHNFKAGAMNALIRVSSKISNGAIILNLDCDMYSNTSQSVRDALCFFMDEHKGHEIAYVQFPQNFENVTKNDVYASYMRLICEVDFYGLDGLGGPLYVGTGCFHRRDTLCGKVYSRDQSRSEWKRESGQKQTEATAYEERLKDLANCTFEKNTRWGNEIGLKYGCPVEDVITGLSIQSNGWKSVYCNPERRDFFGVAPTTLDQTLVMYKRWSEGDLQIMLSKYSPAWYGLGRINPGLILGYSVYCLWAPSSLATLYYCIIPSLHLLSGISLFPQVSSPWFLPFAYIIISCYTYDFAEFLWSGGTVLGWWNDQRMWVYKRTSSYLFGLVDTILRLIGYSNMSFIISSKVSDQEASERYEQEMMEFGTSSPMVTILATLAMLNMFCFGGLVKQVVMGVGFIRAYETMAIQIILCSFLILINWPIYQGLFLRQDKGKLPSSVAVKSVSLALFACTCFSLIN